MKLPLKGNVSYFDDFLSPSESQELYDLFINTYKLPDSRLIFESDGQIIKTNSFKILIVTQEILDKEPQLQFSQWKNHLFEGQLLDLKHKVEAFTKGSYEIAMVLYYPDGSYDIPFHSDQLTSGNKTVVPSLSLGTARNFVFRDCHDQSLYQMKLASGSLLVMGENCQVENEHSLPLDPTCKTGRINVTFREAGFQ